MSWAKKASDHVRSVWIPHRNFRQAESEALAALLTADPGEVLCILGPSRVGKSSLVERMKHSLIGDSPTDGSMPMVSIVLENNSTSGLLSSKSFTVSALLAVRHPMFGTEMPEDLWGIERMRKIERTPEAVLRTAFENALMYRGSKYLIIDEGHHLLYARGGLEAAAAQLDSLKCLAARTKVVLILVAAYPMLELLAMLPHLIGRKLQVHFARYRADSESDVFEFNRILIQYSESLRFAGSQSLRDWNEYLYSGSFGCLGLLRGWIRDALNRAWLSDDPVLTRQHFEASRKTDQDLQSLFREIQSGEEALRQISGSPSLAHNSKEISKDQPKAKEVGRSPQSRDVSQSAKGVTQMESSYLFSLPLRGAGTTDVESLSSYLCRLSIAHSASITDVIEHAFLWLRRSARPDLAMPFVARSPESLSYYVRPNGTTHILVDALESATQREDLRCGTFLSLERAVSRCMGTFHRLMRWCPLCIGEFVVSGDEGYMKLQWQLCDVERCAVHGVPLIDRCPRCRRHQSGCARRETVTHCLICRRPLCADANDLPSPGSWKVESADLLELIDDIATKPSLLYPAEGPRAVLTELFDRVWQCEDELRLWKMVPRDEVLSIVDGMMPVSLRTARRLAYQLGIRLVDLLAGALAPTTDVLDATWTAKLPVGMRPKRRSARRDRLRLMTALEDALRRGRSGAPEPLRQLAKRLGVSTGCLGYHFPELSRELLKLHAQWKHSEKNRKRLEARAAVLEYLASPSPDKPSSHKGMLRLLRMQTRLPKEILRHEIARCT